MQGRSQNFSRGTDSFPNPSPPPPTPKSQIVFTCLDSPIPHFPQYTLPPKRFAYKPCFQFSIWVEKVQCFHRVWGIAFELIKWHMHVFAIEVTICHFRFAGSFSPPMIMSQVDSQWKPTVWKNTVLCIIDNIFKTKLCSNWFNISWFYFCFLYSFISFFNFSRHASASVLPGSYSPTIFLITFGKVLLDMM